MVQLDTGMMLKRARRFVEEVVRPAIYTDYTEVETGVYQCGEPIPYDEAVRKEYKPVKPGFLWGPFWSTAWFRINGEVPAGFKGKDFRLRFDTRTEALCWWKGVPYQGLELHRQDVKLPDEVAVGKEFTVYIEAACNHLFGIGPQYGEPDRFGNLQEIGGGILKEVNIAVYHPKCDRLAIYLDTIIDLLQNLKQDSSNARFISELLRKACNGIDKDDVEGSCGDVLAMIEKELPACNRAFDNTAYCVGNSHLDLAWLWPIRETRRKAARTFSTAMRNFERHGKYRFFQSQAQMYEWVSRDYPQLFEQLKAGAAAGRLEVGGGMWVEADCNLTSGESLARQFLYGCRYFKEHFNTRSRFCWLPDVFGYSASMPQLLKLAGIDYFLSVKLAYNQFDRFPYHTFEWAGIDGSKVVSHFFPIDCYVGMNKPAEMLSGNARYSQQAQCPNWLNPYGWGDGGGGPTESMIERIDVLEKMSGVDGMPNIKASRVDEFCDALAACGNLPRWHGELYFELHRGTYTTQARNKRWNRLCERLLQDVEFACCLAGFKAEEKTQLQQLWKVVLLNQFHDIIPGSSIGWVYEDSTRDYEAVSEKATRLLHAAIKRTARQLELKAGGNSLAVLNTASRIRDAIITLPKDANGQSCAFEGKSYPVQQVRDIEGEEQAIAIIPGIGPLSLNSVELKESAAATGESRVWAQGLTLENEFIKAVLDEAGRIVSLIDKGTGREAMRKSGLGNRLMLYEDLPIASDAWDIDIYYLDKGKAISEPAEWKVIENGPVRAGIEFKRPVGKSSSMTQRVLLTAGQKYLEFETAVDWHESNVVLRTLFDADVMSDHATYEIQFGHLQRPTHFNTSWDCAKFEVCGHRWMDLSEAGFGIALLNDCKYGHSCHENVMGITLLRAPKSPDAAADMGRHYFRYAVMPHGDFDAGEIIAAAEQMNQPCRVVMVDGTPGRKSSVSFVKSLELNGVVIDTIKPAEDGNDFIIRLYECRGGKGEANLELPRDAGSFQGVNLLEESLTGDERIKGGKLKRSLRKFEVLSIKCERQF